MRIIDAHTHIFPSKIAFKASESIGNFYGIPMHYVYRQSLEANIVWYVPLRFPLHRWKPLTISL